MSPIARLLALALLTVSAASAGSPNIVVLFSDDAGYADFGIQEKADPALAKLTPRLTALAKEGIVFTNAYVSGAVCSPSRAGAMTGRYQQRFGHDKNIPPGYLKGGLPLSEKLIGDRLRPLGYTTGLIGKWHLGYPTGYHPNQRGFDHFFGMLQGSRSYFPMKKENGHRSFLLNDKVTPEGGYTTDRIGDGACDFIRSNKEKPFFLFVAFTTPHGPLQPKPEDLKAIGKIGDERRTKYAELVKSLDENCGKILDCLEEEGLAKNTLVVFSNDNGGQTQTGAVNTPLRGHKGEVVEGGIRVPMAMRWPGVIPSGTRNDSPVISLDWFPTFVEASGNKAEPEWKLDGTSLMPLLKDPSIKLPERALYWRTSGGKGPIAIREGDWKLIKLRGKSATGPELYNLKEDISEANNLAAGNPDKVKALEEKLDAWESGLIEPLW
ncbi:sulfatase [Luteolibacter arcticus]|uniref:Sulfatase n=1 Tax=Luteolibacter arcticus TaxID=1581411 RepID=A0ABT3GDV8_9BACT|nr:sulfatase [Luteolibacter arcticus]MCW1921812.1 sulfatase [Luteolibacter arcticus]